MTAATLNVSTNQETFDAVCKHLFAMTKRAITESGFCSYRTIDGRRCAIGALISDRQAEKAGITYRTGGSVFALVTYDHLLNVGDVDLDLLGDLQQVHDDLRNWNGSSTGGIVIDAVLNDTGRGELARIAEKYGLIGPQP